jgi:hypothetical protein
MLLQASEEIAKKYGGNKQKIAQAVQAGLLGPTEAVLAGMFIDRMREAQAEEQAPQQTVAEQVFSPKPAPQGMSQMQLAQQGLGGVPTPKMPTGVNMGTPQQPQMTAQIPRGMGATPQAAQMQAMQQKMAPRPSVAGMNQLPMGPGMIPRAASGGLLAFAGGGDVPGYAPGGGLRYGTPYSNPVILDPFTNQRDARLERRSLISEKERLLRNDFLPNSAAVSDIDQQIQRFNDFLSIPRAELMERRAEAGNTPPRSTTINTGPQSYDPLTQGKIPGNMMGMGDGTVMPNDPNERYIDPVSRAPSEEFVTIDGTGANLNAQQEKGLGATPTAVKAAEEGVISRDGVLVADMPKANSETSFYDIPGLTDREVPVDREAEAYKKFEELRSEGPVTVEKAADKGPSVAKQERANRTPFVPDFMSSSADDLTADTTLADTTADIDDIANTGLGEGEKAALDYYKKAEERAIEGKDKAVGYMLIDIGAGMMADDSPYFLQAAGKAIQSGAEKYKEDIDKQVAAQESALSKRSAFDVTRRNRQIENLKLSLDKYKGDARNEISAKITSLQEGNKVDLARMDDETRREMQLLNLITNSEEKQADREHTSRENQANRLTQERITTLNNYGRAAEGELERGFKFSLQEKQNVFADAQLQANLMFQGEENRLKRENALKVVEMQLNNPTDFETQVDAFEKRILEEAKANNLTMTDADARAQAVQAVYDGQAMVANAAKFDVAAAQVIDNAYKLAVDAWNAMLPGDPNKKNTTFEKFADQIVNNYMSQVGKNTNILGNRPGRASGMETYADFRTPRQ